jgi:hypothetical protein
VNDYRRVWGGGKRVLNYLTYWLTVWALSSLCHALDWCEVFRWGNISCDMKARRRGKTSRLVTEIVSGIIRTWHSSQNFSSWRNWPAPNILHGFSSTVLI